MKPKFKSGAFRTGMGRYSNWAGGVGTGLFTNLGVGGDYSDVATHQTYTANGTPSSSSGSFDWNNFINGLLNSGTSIVDSVWGHNNQWQVNGLQSELDAERKTNTMLWIVIGLVLALGVFLVIRKTK